MCHSVPFRLSSSIPLIVQRAVRKWTSMHELTREHREAALSETVEGENKVKSLENYIEQLQDVRNFIRRNVAAGLYYVDPMRSDQIQKLL